MHTSLAERPRAVQELGHILLVEDDPADATMVKAMLAEQIGWAESLEVVDHLKAACNRLDEGKVDLILLDLNLPDSLSFRESIARLREKTDTPIVVLTGQPWDAVAEECIRLGAEDCLTKDDLDPLLLFRTAVHSVSRHRVTAERLRELVNRFDTSPARHEEISTASEPMVVVGADGRVRFVNDAGCRFLALPFETLVGSDLIRLLSMRSQDRRRRPVQFERIGDVLWNGESCHVLLISANRNE